MPRIVVPPTAKAGPGSAFSGKSWAKKQVDRRRSQPSQRDVEAATVAVKQKKTSKESDVLEWRAESEEDQTLLKKTVEPNRNPTIRMEQTVNDYSPALTDILSDETLSNQVLALDTRYLENDGETRQCIVDFCKFVREFFRTVRARGVLPNRIALTGMAPPKPNKKNASNVGLSLYDLRDENSWKSIVEGSVLGPVCIRTQENNQGTALEIPRSLGAKFSWKLFGELGRRSRVLFALYSLIASKRTFTLLQPSVHSHFFFTLLLLTLLQFHSYRFPFLWHQLVIVWRTNCLIRPPSLLRPN
jgi:hypothetical protein